MNTPVEINVGDTITFTAQGQDQEDAELEYEFSVQAAGGTFLIRQEWSTNNQWVWEVGPEDFGVDITVGISVRDSDGLDEFGEAGGDDYTFAIYNVTDPNALVQPVITELRDSLGNVTTNSIATNQQLGWPDSVRQPVRVNIGDRIRFNVKAESFDGQTLEYLFAVQPPGGSLETIQDWSTSSSAVWTVVAEQFGEGAFVYVAVRNQDSKDLYGEFGGDDYADGQYSVNDPNASYPAELVSVRDSFGRVQTNSIGTNGQLGWSDGRERATVIEGNKITFTAIGEDPDSSSLEYQFAVQTVSSSFVVRQAWSSDNTWEWEATRDDFGRELAVSVAVRDKDGRSRFGEFGGDDYTSLSYRVSVDISGAISILL